MPRKNLTKKQIQEATTMELVLRTNALYALSDRRPKDASTPVADIREAKAIDEEIRLRLYKILAGFNESRK